METINQRLQRLRKLAHLGGGQKRIQGQHGKGKLTARERLSILLDKDSFEEMGTFVTHNCTEFDMEESIFPARVCI